MAEARAQAAATAPVLSISGLHVYYGHAHALQGVNLTLTQDVLGVVGRNGMARPRSATPSWG